MNWYTKQDIPCIPENEWSVLPENGENQICRVQKKEHAYLIAAAPKMLATLKEMKNIIEYDLGFIEAPAKRRPLVERLRLLEDAIQDAEGE